MFTHYAHGCILYKYPGVCVGNGSSNCDVDDHHCAVSQHEVELSTVKTEVEADGHEGERAIPCTIPPPWRQLSDSSMDLMGCVYL